MGTVARIVKLLKMGEDNYSLVVQGLARFRVLELVQETPYLKARVEAVEDKTAAENVEVEALGINLKKLAREVIELMPELPAAATELVESITHPGHLADLIAANVDVPIEEKQAVLETVDLKARMKLVLELLNRKREILKLSNKIDSAVKGEMSKTQREYYLRQQLKAIKEELGEMGEEEEELDELQERLKKAGLPPEVEKVAHEGAQPPEDHPGGVLRVHRRAHLPRLDRGPAVVEAERGQPRHRERARRSSTPTTTASRR